MNQAVAGQNIETQDNVPSRHPSRSSTMVKRISIVLIVLALIWIMRMLPVDRGVQVIRSWVEGLGVWGPVVFALLYVIATVFLLPASALTLAAGAIFGLVKGSITVSLGSNIGAAFAFLIGRYLARNKVTKITKQYPKFEAIDKAIGESGWKIVALMRLSPAIPFNMQNYLYGLTSIRFWPCVLTSWLAMMPGTFMYIYLGHLGGQGLEAATGAAPSKGVAEWVLLGVGLLATVLVTVFITRIAMRALRERTQIDDAVSIDHHAAPSASSSSSHTPESASRWAAGTFASASFAVVALVAAAYLHFNPQVFAGIFGPPAAKLTEAYQDKPGGAAFDHSKFDELLHQVVDENGWVDYPAIVREPAPLDQYLVSLQNAPFDELGRNEKLALLINAYNAFTIRLIVDNWNSGKLKSIKDIPSSRRWDDSRWRVGPHTWSLTQIEHEQIRPKFKEPRIHFALVCAAVGCPKLRNEAYQASRIEEQLEDQAHYAHAHERWFLFEAGSDVVRLTKLYDWYGGDFKQVAGTVLDFAGRYCPPLKQELADGRKPKIKWLEYDWRLNDKSNTP